ncbi:MAG: hypothetical protein J6S59_07160 [Clostridia bacterium]|nr:hypothetical protein [Clostridia bacterium]
MILTVSNISSSLDTTSDEIIAAARRKAKLPDSYPGSISRRSVDARRGKVGFVWSVSFTVSDSVKVRPAQDIRLSDEEIIDYSCGRRQSDLRPVVVGFGPAGMLAALTLADAGFCPVVLERGSSVETRDGDVSSFFKTGKLNSESNIQFGEGGAGTYSDGKLNTGVNSPLCREVLRQFVRFGANPDILISAKPHIGTDALKGIVMRIREHIRSMGGEIRFNTKMTGLRMQDGKLTAVSTDLGDIPAEICILAIGHSARDTFRYLYGAGIPMEQKLFSMGVRIEHLQSDIDEALYGTYAGHPALGPADYKLWDRSGERGVYSFCMCPGGTVVAAASMESGVVTNGMSDSRRSGRNANAALVVEILPSDMPDSHPLAGLILQENVERKAFIAAGEKYAAPVCRLSDFMSGRLHSDGPGIVEPTYPAGISWQEVSPFFLSGAADALRASLPRFASRIRGFDRPDALLTAPETRTSSPVRILRGEDLYSPAAEGLIPCGEGAGYAGGITSAAADGLRCALRILREFAPPKGDRHA